MRLKKLEIFGFKSFADKIEIQFDEGITAIVGPNGSGKSNIGDAVRWVLGEQNARVLRGAHMEDIIFNGTAKRKALSFCEVNLTIDNAEGQLPVAYSEVTITRRVFRSGESEYYINKQSCRLKDVIDLFRDTGMGKEGYSIVGQGEIIEIINSKPEDRRGAFHESAGIMKFRVRKEEAERRLENTRLNLQRLNDIAAEVESQLEPMRRQSEDAREYLTLSAELKDLEVNQYLLQYDRLKQRLEAVQEQESQLAGQIGQRSADIEALERELASFLEELDGLDSSSGTLRDEIAALAAEEQRREGERNLANERIAARNRDAARMDGEAQGALARAAQLDDEANAVEGQLAEQDEQIARSTARIAELEAQATEMGEQLRGEEARAEEHKAQMMATLNKIGDIKSSLGRLEALEENARTRLEQMDGLAEKHARELAIVGDAKAEISQSIASLNDQLGQFQQGREQANSRVLELAGTRKQIDENNMRLRERLQAATTRVNMLSAMKRDYEGYIEAVKRLLVDCRSNAQLKTSVEGVVGELLEVPANLVRAVEMALGPAMQNIVTPTEEDAKRLIQHLRRNNYGRATFLPVASVRGRTLNAHEEHVLSMKGCVGLGSDLVKYDGRYRDIVLSLLGRTVIAEDMDSAIAMARACGHTVRFSTLQGDIINPGGSMTGGSVNSRFTSLLSRSAEMEELSALKGRLDEELKENGDYAARIEKQGQEAAQALEGFSDGAHRLELELAREKERQEKAAQTEERLLASRQALEEERAQLEENLQDIAEERSAIESRQGGEEQSNADVRSELIRMQQQINEQRERFAALQEQVNDCKVALASDTRHRAALESDLQRLRREAGQQRDSAAQTQLALERLRGEIERETEALHSTAAGGQEHADKRAQTEERLRETEERRLALRGERADKEKQLTAARHDLDELKEQQYKHQAQGGRAEADLENLQNRIWDNYELTYAMALELQRPDFEPAGANRRINEIRERIRAMGTVNVNAIEDYVALKSRFEDLQRQTADLAKAEADLMEIIGELNEKMEKRFREQFKLLNGYFGDTFVELFGGGTARLVLKDENDLLNSGIDIVAQPPGKQLQLLSLLSGGEKSLTAIALLFAMLKLNPSPFCLLDAIEAAKDDLNVKRFANYLNEYTSKTQFVVVTHRKGTMEASNAIYGVTMEEKGISRLVSMKMADYIEA